MSVSSVTLCSSQSAAGVHTSETSTANRGVFMNVHTVPTRQIDYTICGVMLLASIPMNFPSKAQIVYLTLDNYFLNIYLPS